MWCMALRRGALTLRLVAAGGAHLCADHAVAVHVERFVRVHRVLPRLQQLSLRLVHGLFDPAPRTKAALVTVSMPVAVPTPVPTAAAGARARSVVKPEAIPVDGQAGGQSGGSKGGTALGGPWANAQRVAPCGSGGRTDLRARRCCASG